MRAKQSSITALVLPNVDAINERERYRETQLAANPKALRRFLEERKNGIAPGMPRVPGQAPIKEPSQTVSSHSKSGDDKSDPSKKADGQAKAGGESPPPTEPPRAARWRKAREQGLLRLRELARLGAADAAASARDDPLQQYKETR